jgi:DNA-directed RNA polymerase specialized sigma24 family protein
MTLSADRAGRQVDEVFSFPDRDCLVVRDEDELTVLLHGQIAVRGHVRAFLDLEPRDVIGVKGDLPLVLLRYFDEDVDGDRFRIHDFCLQVGPAGHAAGFRRHHSPMLVPAPDSDILPEMSGSTGGRAWEDSRSVALSVTDPAEPVRARAEIATAIRALTPAQWVRLRKVAAYYALGRPIEAEDLLQEGFRRALDGERRCPVTVDVVRFLAEAMRSIANSELRRAKRRPALVPLPAPDDPATQVPKPMDPAPNAEERLAADEETLRERQRQQIIGLFADDPAAQVIVEGLMEGMKGEDLRALTDLDQTAYESKRRLIRRRIGRYLQGREP